MITAPSILDVELSPHKYLQHVDRLRTLARGGDTYPVTVELDPVDFCNHRCGWCVDPQHGGSILDLGLAGTLLRELRTLGVEGLVLKGGGEPTLHPHFNDLLEMGSSLGFHIGIVTNGSRLSSLAEALARNAEYVRVSVDGPTAGSHRHIHGTDDFEEVVTGIRRLAESRGVRRHPVVGLSFAMDVHTVHLAQEAIRLGEQLGVDYVLFRTPFFEEVGREPTMSPREARSVRDVFVALRRQHTGRTLVLVDHWISDSEARTIADPPEASPRRGSWIGSGANGIEHVTRRCLAAPLLAVVTSTGHVYPCCNLRALKDWCIGRLDYASAVTFEALWNGDQRRNVMRNIHRAGCLRWCTHPLSRYNEAIEYLAGPAHHRAFL